MYDNLKSPSAYSSTKQDKYTMDPRHLSQKQQKNFGQKWFLNNKIKKKNFQKKIWEKIKFLKSIFEKNFFWQKNLKKKSESTSSNYT